jgi:hypothetical protein
MTVNSPNEGTRLFGRDVGAESAWVHQNNFHAHYNASEDTILAALQAEIKKKMEA